MTDCQHCKETARAHVEHRNDSPFRDREHMLNCLLDAEIQAYRRPGMTAGELAPLLSTDDLRTLYWQRKIRELAEAQGMDPDADA